MKNKFYLVLITILAIGLASVACEGPSGPDGPQGPQGEQGPEGPQGVQGNANVTLYIFDGHDFSTSTEIHRDIEVNNPEESVWLVYLIESATTVCNNPLGCGYLLPGTGFLGDSYYRVFLQYSLTPFRISINRESGPGEEYSTIHIIRIEATNVEDHTNLSKKVSTLIPGDLDVSDFNAVIEYYGLEP